MQVRYNPMMPVTFVVLGSAGLLAGLMVSAGGTFSPSVVVGPLMLLIGILQLTRPYFEFDPVTGILAVKALAGPTFRRFGGSAGGRLGVVGNQIVCTRPDGRVKKVPVSHLLAKTDEWNAVIARIS
jgi:hypothetical protein